MDNKEIEKMIQTQYVENIRDIPNSCIKYGKDVTNMTNTLFSYIISYNKRPNLKKLIKTINKAIRHITDDNEVFKETSLKMLAIFLEDNILNNLKDADREICLKEINLEWD